ncbi:hypothetical protein D9M71_197510 [compost metagenome]
MLPLLALRRVRAPFDVGNGSGIGRHQAHTGTGFDGHVADGHAAFHRQFANGTASEFHGVTVATGSADLADHGQDDVLGGDAGRQLAFHAHQHVLHLLGDQALGGEHVLDLGGADAVGQGTESAVGGGVRVTADHGHARQGGALLRADDVDDALALVIHLEFDDAVFVTVLVEGLYLQARNLVDDRLDTALALWRGRYVVVRRGDVGVDTPRFAIGQAQAFEGLGRRHFVDDVAVDVDQGRAVITALDLMGFPEFVVERFASHQTVPHQRLSMPKTPWLVRTMLGG